ncbi:MAG: F420-0--gamma-glutamyl ligase [Epulopiscium sp.]|nr:F420-0--gamma-glutamyl ligase [Candidatus Epulonipiscium sp.]
MGRTVGTISRGIRTPIFKEGDDVPSIVVDSILEAAKAENFEIQDKDIVSITESVIARAQGNYADISAISKDINSKFGDDTIGVIFPILSRNRFSLCLKGIAQGAKKVVLMLSYPADEVGNHLIDIDMLDEKKVNPWTDTLTEEDFRNNFGYPKHAFTGMDYIAYYKSIIEESGAQCQIILSNNPRTILDYTKSVLVCDIHTRTRTKRILKENGASKIYGLDDILTSPIDGNGYNPDYGLLGSNLATDNSIKMFPRDCQPIVDEIQALFKEKTGKHIEVMVYGDGAFKDPIGKIWELADPVVSPAYTDGLEGKPSEIKLKYLADNDFAHLKGKELEDALYDYINNRVDKDEDSNESMGTTPRRLTDLVGSLSDLTSGSGDKGTPVVYIQGYFDSYQ